MTAQEYHSQIVCAFGRKGSGKSQLLWSQFTSLAPRVITLGHVPQDLARTPNVVKTRGWHELARAIERASAFSRWHIAAALDPSYLDKLFTLLAPPLEVAPERSLALALGGVAIETGEAYEPFPVGYTPDVRLAAVRRSRHYALDFYLGSQRPHSVHREVTAAADLIFAFAQSEPRDIAFLGESVSRPFAAAVRALRFDAHECVMHDRSDGSSAFIRKDYRMAGRLAEAAAGQ